MLFSHIIPATRWVALGCTMHSQWYGPLGLDREKEERDEGMKRVTIKLGEGISLKGHRARTFLLVSSRGPDFLPLGLCGTDILFEKS